jgi:hypothetical protein
MKNIQSIFKNNLELVIVVPIMIFFFVLVNEAHETNKEIFYNVFYNNELIGIMDANNLPINLDLCTHIKSSYYCKNGISYKKVK